MFIHQLKYDLFPVSCPNGQIFKNCVSPCPSECPKETESPCESTDDCFPGCDCPDGKWKTEDDQCVALEDCPAGEEKNSIKLY